MASKLPLCIYSGLLKELVAGDTLAISRLDVTGATPIARVYSTSNDSDLQINRPAGKFGQLSFMTGGSLRWQWFVDSTAEAGSSAGSDYAFVRYSDAGVGSYVLSVNRATGAGVLFGPWSVTGPLTSSAGELATTGDFKFVLRASPPTGWIVADGTTIGNVGSGAGRANVDTLALFTAWWTDYTNAQCPMLTSAGAASSRGASAAADWAALKRLTLINMTGRFPRAAGTINSLTFVNGTQYADSLKTHTHASPGGIRMYSVGGPSPWVVDGTAGFATEVWSTGNPSTGTASETAPVSVAMLPCVKL